MSANYNPRFHVESFALMFNLNGREQIVKANIFTFLKKDIERN